MVSRWIICKEHPEYEETKKTYKRIIYDDISKLKENDITINNKKLLKDTIYDLRNNPKACTIYGGYSNNEILIMPDTEIGEQLNKFIKYFYENKFMDFNYLKNCKERNRRINI